jgi:two-component system, NarL family, nitrate/nitrite response regulator NarL
MNGTARDEALPEQCDAKPIRVLVVDDHPLFRRGLTAILCRSTNVLVVGDAGDATEAQRRVEELEPDVILHLPGVNGVDALPALRDAFPQVRIIMLTVSEDENDLAASLKAGANGYLLKTMDAEALIAAVVRVMQGESVIADEMTSKLVAAYRGAIENAPVAVTSIEPIAHAISPLSQLSPRELDILRGIALGESNKLIARHLGIAETTVKIHVQHVLRKLNVASRVQAAVIATGLPLN